MFPSPIDLLPLKTRDSGCTISLEHRLSLPDKGQYGRVPSRLKCFVAVGLFATVPYFGTVRFDVVPDSRKAFRIFAKDSDSTGFEV